MNSERFDRLARRLVAALPRRQAIALLVSVGLSPLAWPPREAQAKCKKLNKKCD